MGTQYHAYFIETDNFLTALQEEIDNPDPEIDFFYSDHNFIEKESSIPLIRDYKVLNFYDVLDYLEPRVPPEAMDNITYFMFMFIEVRAKKYREATRKYEQQLQAIGLDAWILDQVDLPRVQAAGKAAFEYLQAHEKQLEKQEETRERPTWHLGLFGPKTVTETVTLQEPPEDYDLFFYSIDEWTQLVTNAIERNRGLLIVPL